LNPFLGLPSEQLGYSNHIFHFNVGDPPGGIIVRDVPLSSSPVEESCNLVNGLAHTQLQTLKRYVMRPEASNSVAAARYHHFRALQSCVVGSCKSSIGGQTRDLCVCEVSGHDTPQLA